MSGFTPQITAKNLESNVSDVELFLLAGLKPGFPLTLNLFNVVPIEARPFLSLPNLSMNVTQRRTDQVGANCNETGDTDPRFKDAFKNLTHVQYDVGIGGGVEIPLIGDITFASTSFPLATQCLVYKATGESTGLAVATAVLAEITKPPEPTATVSQKKSVASKSLMMSVMGLSTYWKGAVAFLYIFCVLSEIL